MSKELSEVIITLIKQGGETAVNIFVVIKGVELLRVIAIGVIVLIALKGMYELIKYCVDAENKEKGKK